MLKPENHAISSNIGDPGVLRFTDCDQTALEQLLARFGLELESVADHETIPGSFWGDEEAGLIGAQLLVRADTPVHSILHETAHFICMDAGRRSRLNRDAGGDDAEEQAVCYLQILLSAWLPDVQPAVMLRDMDAWGYSFRLGSAKAWFEQDAGDARQWLLDKGLIDDQQQPAWAVRGD